MGAIRPVQRDGRPDGRARTQALSPRRYRITIRGTPYSVEVGDLSASPVTVTVDGVDYEVELPGVGDRRSEAPRVRPAATARAAPARPAAPRPSVSNQTGEGMIRAVMPGRRSFGERESGRARGERAAGTNYRVDEDGTDHRCARKTAWFAPCMFRRGTLSSTDRRSWNWSNGSRWTLLADSAPFGKASRRSGQTLESSQCGLSRQDCSTSALPSVRNLCCWSRSPRGILFANLPLGELIRPGGGGEPIGFIRVFQDFGLTTDIIAAARISWPWRVDRL